MKILITGANGFVAYYLIEQLLEAGHDIIATGKGENRLPFKHSHFSYCPMDFTDPFAVHDVFEKSQPHIVIHTGAMSKPDECEQHQWEAYVTNVESTVTLLINAAEQKSFFIFLSTDFVFDGEKGMYREDELASPVNFYGKTKWEAEQAVQEYEFDWCIIRTVLVYGKHWEGHRNLLFIIKDKIEKGESYKVFNDQVRTPTYVEDLANGISLVVEKKATGIFHICGEEVLTPYEMACRMTSFLDLDGSLIEKVTAAEFNQPARRPLLTGLNIEKAKKELGFQPVSFQEGLKKTFPGQK